MFTAYRQYQFPHQRQRGRSCGRDRSCAICATGGARGFSSCSIASRRRTRSAVGGCVRSSDGSGTLWPGRSRCSKRPPWHLVHAVQRRCKPAGIARQSGTAEVGVELARARQRQLQQRAHRRRQDHEQQELEGERRPPAEQDGRQLDEEHELPDPRQHVDHTSKDVGQTEHLGVVVRNMRDLVRQDRLHLARLQAAQQAIGDTDCGVAA